MQCLLLQVCQIIQKIALCLKLIYKAIQKRHKINDTIILQPYVIVMWFSAKCSETNSLHD